MLKPAQNREVSGNSKAGAGAQNHRDSSGRSDKNGSKAAKGNEAAKERNNVLSSLYFKVKSDPM